MSGLLLPKHAARQAAITASVGKSARHRIDSDDWATGADVKAQLAQLAEYMAERRAVEPEYNLPIPTGWKVMMLMLTIPEKSAGGVIVIDDAKEARSLSSPQGVVLAIGEQAYQDPSRFNGPWLKVGDRTTVVKYDASMFQLGNGQRLGFVNDTQPISVIDRGWEVPK